MATPRATHAYTYNDIYELASSRVRDNLPHTDVHDGIPHDFVYDSVGNRIDVDGTTYVPNELNQYESVGGTAYSYDGNGNLTNDGTNTYTYDVENRLTNAQTPSHNASYEYDGFGRRISKTVDGSTTYFIYDGDQVIEERGAGGLVSYTYGTGIDEVLTMKRNGETYYYFYDGLGSVSDITDSTGEVVETYSYDVYGAPSQVSSIGNPYYFTGRRFDEESGLYYYRARYYSPTIGRFLQRDLYTWGPDDRRILMKSTDFSDVLSSILGVNSASENDKRKIEQNFLLNNQFMPSGDYFADSSLGLNFSTEALRFAIANLGQLNPQFFVNQYLYANNNPVNYIDPEGELPHIVIVVVAATLAVVLLVETILYYVNDVLRKEMPNFPPGPAQKPYQPLNSMQQGPTGRLPCGR